MKRPVLHLISQAHLDPVWLWPLRDGVSEALTTLQSAIDRADENPDFRFTRSSACTYRWARDIDPVLYESIRRQVAEGRWEVIGGWIEQPDCNLPSAESFIRQGLYGKAFFEREFGESGSTSIGYNPDSFGHCGGLPQLLRHSDFDGYAFMRPQPWDNPNLPVLFWWESKDGSRVLACRIPEGYSQSYAATPDDIERIIREAPEKNFPEGMDHGVLWFGIGNHGGGPTREHIGRIRELQKDDSLPEIRFSTVRDFMQAVRNSPGASKLKVVREELGFVMRGCYAATGEVKQLNRFSEKALQAAEFMDVLSNGRGADPKALADAWWKLLFNQFHDILAGTCTPLPQEETRSRFGASLTDALEHRMKCVFQIARRVDTRQESGSLLFAANPLPWPRKAVVSLDTFIEPHGREEIAGLETQDGRQIPFQWTRADANFGPWGLRWGKLNALVDLPAGGYAVYRVVTRPMERKAEAPSADVDERNAQFTGIRQEAEGPASLTEEPALPAWTVDGIGELFKSALGTIVVRDEENTWGFGVETYTEVLGKPEVFETEMLESGDIFTVVRQKSRWKQSEIWMDVVKYNYTATVEIRFRLNWQEKREQLRLEIPSRLQATRTVARMPAEGVERPADGRECPCHDWVALEGTLDGRPVSIGLINDSSYSYHAEGGNLRIALARGVPHAEHPPFDYKDVRNIPFLDQGWQERRFWLTACPGNAPVARLDRESQEWQIPAEPMLDNPHPGTRPWSGSLFSVEPENIEVLALKPAESGEGSILRIRESSGLQTIARIQLHGTHFEIPVGPFGIATRRLNLDTGEAAGVNGLEQPAPLA